MNLSKSNKSAQFKTATASTPKGEFQKHLVALQIQSAVEYRNWCLEHGYKPRLEKNWQERRDEVRFAMKQCRATKTQLKLKTHWESLGLKSLEVYNAWCKSRGFSVSISKSQSQLEQESLNFQREKSEKTVDISRHFERKPTETLQTLFQTPVPLEDIHSPLLREIKAAVDLTGNRADVREALLRILIIAKLKSRLVNSGQAIASFGSTPENTFIRALLVVSLRYSQWIRPPEEWKADSHNPHRQFSSLIRHLFAKYPVPVFMDSCWFERESDSGEIHRELFLHLAKGNNIRTAEMNLKLTKRGAHLFSQAPKDFPVETALRWSQVLSLGGDRNLARNIAQTRLAKLQPDEAFWQSVVFFFINNPMLDPRQIIPIIDFIHNRKFVASEIVKPDGEVEIAIPEQNFSMKGRTGVALLKRLEEWHRALAKETRRPEKVWPPCGLNPFQLKKREEATGIETVWTIEELLSSRALQEEGKAMRHCVASYAPSCLRGSISIWSMQVCESHTGSCRRVMTIEVENQRKLIVQARGRCNKTPGEKRAAPRLALAPDILKRWGREAGLIVPSYLFD